MDRRDFIRTGGTAAAATVAARLLASESRPPDKLRIAQIGTAHAHAAKKWATARSLPDLFDCIGIWEPDPARRRQVMSEPEYRGARWLDENAIFGDPTISAILVETELPELLAMGGRCLEAGRHVHLDKPPGTEITELIRLQDIAAKKRCILQMGYMYRYHPAFRFCLDAVRQGWLGEVFSIHGDIGKALDPDRRPWLAENYRGSMMLLGCHLLDIALVVLGCPDAVKVHRRNTFPGQGAFFDHEMTVLEYPGALATIRSMLAEVGGAERRQFLICGTDGTVRIEPLEPAQVTLTLDRPAGNFAAGTHEVEVPPVAARYDAMLRDFAAQIAGKPSSAPAFDPAHDRLVQTVLLQAAGFDAPPAQVQPDRS